MKINAIIVNRNLLTTLKHTIEFLKSDNRINVIICDQNSNYLPLLNFYENYNGKLFKFDVNHGKYGAFRIKELRETDYFIVTDPDCNYSNIPSDWLDKLINVLENNSIYKVGFSLDIENIPENNPFKKRIINWERKYWLDKNDFGYVAKIDTTFALYRKNSILKPDAIRLEKPYMATHVPWELDYSNLDEEWTHYFQNVPDQITHWSRQIKKHIS